MVGMEKKFTPKSDLSTAKLPIRRVVGAGRAWLELRGSILVYHRQSWVGASSMFIPVEWVEVGHDLRHDWRRLWRGVVAVMVACLISFPLTLLLLQQPDVPWFAWVASALSGMMLVNCALGIYFLLSFVRPRALTEFQVEQQGRPLKITFWHAWRRNPDLDALVGCVKAIKQNPKAQIPYPVQMKHEWYKPRPYRIALLRGVAISFFLYLALCAIEVLAWLGQTPAPGIWAYAFLCAPPAYYLLRRALDIGYLSGNPREYVKAMRAYLRGDLGTAAHCLEKVLAENPDEHGARFLLVQVLTEQGAFDDASRHCKKLNGDHPSLAAQLENSIQGIKRMHGRMGGD